MLTDFSFQPYILENKIENQFLSTNFLIFLEYKNLRSVRIFLEIKIGGPHLSFSSISI